MTTLLLTLPLLGLALTFVRPHAPALLVGTMSLCAVLATVNVVDVCVIGTTKEVIIWSNFLTVGHPGSYYSVDVKVYFDFYSAYLVWVVYVVSALVHLYSTVYMGSDPRKYLFLSYLSLFTFFMVLLLVSGNYVQLFMGWEGVGLTSYLLVNFWHTRVAANKSALKALLVNRVGDVFFLWGVLTLVTHHGTLQFIDLQLNHHPGTPLFLIAAAAAKSAQLGLHTWLPDAMEGPTPVSALIHAATMVTAGIFLLFRSVHLVEPARPFLLIVGAITALFAGTVAVFQFDLKRVIAYSTCSQLGFMTVAYSLGCPELSLYHLSNHAFFKALLFLLAGLVIHSLADEQDMRRMGGLVNVLPVTYVLFTLGSLALAGFPFLSGFYSKDTILEVLYAKGFWFSYFACLLAAYLTAYYSFRTLVLVFFGRPYGSQRVYLGAGEADRTSLWVVTVLGGLSLLHGYVTRDLFVGWGRPVGWMTPVVESEFAVPLWIKLLPLIFSMTAATLVVTGVAVGWSRTWTLFFAKRWWWDTVDTAVTRRALVKSYALYCGVERGFFEVVGPAGIRRGLSWAYDLIRNRGWFSFFWLAVVAGFLALGMFFSTGDLVCPYLPLTVLHRRANQADPPC